MRIIHSETWRLGIAQFFLFGGFEAAQQYLVPIYSQSGREHFAYLSLFVLYGAFTIGGGFLAPLLHRLRLRALLLVASPAYLCFIVAAALGNQLLLVAVSMLVGLGAALLWGAPAAYITAIVPEETRARNLAVLPAMAFAGGGAGILMAMLLIAALPKELLFFALLGVASVGIVIYATLKDAPSGKKSTEARNFFASLRNPTVRKSLLVVISGFFALSLVFLRYAAFLEQKFGLALVGPTFLVSWISLAISSLLAGRVVDSLGYQRALKSAVVVLCASVTMVAVGVGMQNVVVFAVGAALGAVFGGSVYPISNALLKKEVSEREYLRAIGWMQSGNGIGVAFAAATSLLFTMKGIVLVLALLTISNALVVFWGPKKIEDCAVFGSTSP